MVSVLFLIPTFDRGGAENVLLDLVNKMDKNRFSITVQTIFDQGAQKEKLRKGIEYKSVFYHQFRGNSCLFSVIPSRLLYRLLVRKRYDVIIAYLEGPATHILLGCPFNDSKKVAWVHVEMNTKKELAVGFSSFAGAVKGYEKLDRIVFVAKTVQDSFRKVTGRIYPTERVLYNTVDSESVLEKALENTSSFSFSKSEFNIISVGRIIDAKGYDRLARIQKRLKDAGYRSHIYIIGAGRSKPEIESYVAVNSIAESFTFLGFQENPYQYVSKADLFVCSSRREGFSTVVTEALILGTPVVSTKCSGAYELLGKNNEFGIVTENSEDALYEGIKDMIDHPDLLKHYREQSKIRGKSFSSEITVKSVEDMIIKLVKDDD
ncbi:MAG: glycosyltransferase [Clostridia bacterium]|nr:glycosyltransferase [Clostridia bacterium]